MDKLLFLMVLITYLLSLIIAYSLSLLVGWVVRTVKGWEAIISPKMIQWMHGIAELEGPHRPSNLKPSILVEMYLGRAAYVTQLCLTSRGNARWHTAVPGAKVLSPTLSLPLCSVALAASEGIFLQWRQSSLHAVTWQREAHWDSLRLSKAPRTQRFSPFLWRDYVMNGMGWSPDWVMHGIGRWWNLGADFTCFHSLWGAKEVKNLSTTHNRLRHGVKLSSPNNRENRDSLFVGSPQKF